MKLFVAKIASLAFVLAPLGVAFPAAAAAPNWDASGNYVANFNYLGSDYAHDIALTQSGGGSLTGSGGSPAGGNVYTWVLTTGSVSEDSIEFYANYTATADAVTPQTVMHVMGVIAPDGTMSGTWSDNYQNGARSGTWETTSGTADEITIAATLAAEDFGVVNYDTGLGMLKGYTAGFGLTDATFEGAQSVVVKLYAGSTLLQTNTATAQVGIDITGTQISSPFDVSGTFAYATDGYWVNVRETQYGQSVAATRVVATVTLEDGTVVTAENTMLTGDPSSIFQEAVVPTHKSQCKNGGWKSFTNPTFKNQGKCIKYVEKHQNDDDEHAGGHGHGNWNGHHNSYDRGHDKDDKKKSDKRRD
jgi:hypothetical protein